MTLYEKGRERKLALKTRVELIKSKQREKTARLNLKRIGL